MSFTKMCDVNYVRLGCDVKISLIQIKPNTFLLAIKRQVRDSPRKLLQKH